MVKVPDCYASDLGSFPGQVSEFFYKFYLVEFVLLDENYEKTRLIQQNLFWGNSIGIKLISDSEKFPAAERLSQNAFNLVSIHL